MTEVAWSFLWAMPGLSIDEPIETRYVAMVNCRDDRLRRAAQRNRTFDQFLKRFHDEFGKRISPTVLLIREDAPESVQRFAIVSFRDAVCACAIVLSQARRLAWGRATGIPYSDAFDVYPWVPGLVDDGRVYAFTPSMGGIHDVKLLRGQPTPPSGQGSLSASDIDAPLLASILDRWERTFVGGEDNSDNRGLFRALDMARAASRMPGGSDATYYDDGRAVALWVSAFEILAHTDGYADARRVLELLGRVPWINKKLKTADRSCRVSRKMAETNVGGEVYIKLHEVRNDFLHGNPVTGETANLPKCKKPVLIFAAPLFRLALTAYLKLEKQDAAGEPNSWGKFIAGRIQFNRFQRDAESAVLVADQPV